MDARGAFAADAAAAAAAAAATRPFGSLADAAAALLPFHALAADDGPEEGEGAGAPVLASAQQLWRAQHEAMARQLQEGAVSVSARFAAAAGYGDAAGEGDSAKRAAEAVLLERCMYHGLREAMASERETLARAQREAREAQARARAAGREAAAAEGALARAQEEERRAAAQEAAFVEAAEAAVAAADAAEGSGAQQPVATVAAGAAPQLEVVLASDVGGAVGGGGEGVMFPAGAVVPGHVVTTDIIEERTDVGMLSAEEASARAEAEAKAAEERAAALAAQRAAAAARAARLRAEREAERERQRALRPKVRAACPRSPSQPRMSAPARAHTLSRLRARVSGAFAPGCARALPEVRTADTLSHPSRARVSTRARTHPHARVATPD